MNYIEELATAIKANLDPRLLPRSDTDRLFRIYAVLALVKGIHVTAADIHHAWAAWQSERWPHSPSLVPFEQLTPEVQSIDESYVDAVRSAARKRLSANRF